MAPKLKNTTEKSSSFWNGLKRHLTFNRNLLPIKAVIFLFYGGATAFLPYITLHMLQIGITIEEVGIIYAVLPFASSFGPPIAGMIADKLGNYKVVLMASTVAMGALHTLLLVVDANGIDPAYIKNPTAADVFLQCDGSDSTRGSTTLEWISSCNDTCPYDKLLKIVTIEVQVSDCIRSCDQGDTATSSLLDFCFTKDSEVICNQDYSSILSENGNLRLNLSETWSVRRDSSSASCILNVDQLILANLSVDPEVVRMNCGVGCSIRCPVSSIAPRIPSCKPQYDHVKHTIGFWVYLLLRILATAALGTVFTMLDASTICLVKKFNGELGKQRLLGVVGAGVFGMLSGILVDWSASWNNGVKSYAITFYVADVTFILVLLILWKMDVTGEKMEGNFLKNCLQLVQMFHIDVFMIMMLLLGSFWGYLEAYLFVFLMEMKASSYLLGLTVTVGALVGIPFLFVSDIIVEKVGRLVILISAFFIYSIRFVGYSYIQDPWMSLPFEALEAVTIHLMGVSCTMYCATTAPAGLLATFQGMAGACHYSLGRGMGSFIGGILISTYGTRVTFRVLGIAACIFGVVYIFLYYFIMRKHENIPSKKSSGKETEMDYSEVVFQSVPKSEEEKVNGYKNDTEKA